MTEAPILHRLASLVHNSAFSHVLSSAVRKQGPRRENGGSSSPPVGIKVRMKKKSENDNHQPNGMFEEK